MRLLPLWGRATIGYRLIGQNDRLTRHSFDRVDVDATSVRDAGLGLAHLEPHAYLVLSLRGQPEPFRSAPRD